MVSELYKPATGACGVFAGGGGTTGEVGAFICGVACGIKDDPFRFVIPPIEEAFGSGVIPPVHGTEGCFGSIL
jgi:hypothetical protein